MRKFYTALLLISAMSFGITLEAQAQASCSTPYYINNDSLPWATPDTPSVHVLTTCGWGNNYEDDPVTTPGYCDNSNEDDEEYVISFTPTATICVDIKQYYNSGDHAVSLFVYRGCPDDAQSVCIDKDTGGNPRELNGITFEQDSAYYIMVQDNSGCGTFWLTIEENTNALGDQCCNPYPLTTDSLPMKRFWNTGTPITDNFDQGSLGMNHPTASSTLLSYAQDNDILFEYTCVATECVSFRVPVDSTFSITETIFIPGNTLTSPDPGVYVLDGCPDSPNSNVLAYDRGSSETPSSVDGNIELTYTLTPGTYYFLIGTKGSPNFVNMWVEMFTQAAPSTGPSCGAPINIAALPYSVTTQNTQCYGVNYNQLDACGSDNLSGEDVVYTFTPGSTTCYDITLTNGDDGAALFVFDDCPDVVTANCIFEEGEVGGTADALGITLTSGTTYYIVVSSDEDDNASVAYDLSVATSGAAGTGATCCTPTVIGALPYTNNGLTTCAFSNDYENKCNNTYMDAEDYIFEYTSAGNECVTITIADGSVTADADVAAFILDGCPNDGSATCLNYATVDNGAAGTLGVSFSAGLAAAGTYYIVVDGSDADVTCSTFDFNITGSAITTGLTCGNAESIGALPFSVTNATTCCFGNDYNSGDACGSSYLDGDDYVYTYTASSDECITVSLTNPDLGADVGLFIFDGCPDNLATNCLAFNTEANTSIQSDGTTTGAVLTNGSTYYIVVSTDAINTCTNFDLDITSQVAGGTGATCANPESINTFPFTLTGESTRCMGDDYDNTSTSSCGALYESGEDKVYEYVKVDPTPQCLSLAITGASTNDIGYQVYDGCPDVGPTSCLANAGGASGGALNATVILPSAGTYYLVIDTWANPSNVDYNISITNNGSSQTNDLPCDAQALTLGAVSYGDNTCSSDAGEVAAPGCWDNGNYNTVWFSVTAPASGELSVKTNAGSLIDTQIGLYSGACGSLSLVSCNDNYTSCGNSLVTSEIVATGLTPGNTYYVRVDGDQDTEGNFTIVAIDGTGAYPSLGGQDCDDVDPLPACADTVRVGNPGYAGTGNNCDFNGTNNCTSGEKASVWYKITIDGSAPINSDLNFNIIPNDGSAGSCGAETDYDFLLWKTTGAGTTTSCAGIAANPGTGLEACNFSALGVTGVAASGNAQAPYSTCFNAAFEPTIVTQPGDEYYLVVQNWTSNSQGFIVDFSNTPVAVIDYVTPTSLLWTGATDAAFDDPDNWGGCVNPDCGIDVTIAAGPTNQPSVTGGTDTLKCNNLTINNGATLTLGPGAVLQVCGDFINLGGTLDFDATSTLLVDSGGSTQNLSGSMTAGNAIGHLLIEKTGGTVELNNAIEMQGDFTTSNVTSVLTVNGNYMTLGGDFNNFDDNTTFDRSGFNSDVLEFNGSAAQQYIPGGPLGLNSVVMNNTGAGVTIVGSNMQTGTAGVISFYQGQLITGARVIVVNNENVAAVTNGNATSYVRGNLRREIDANASTNTYPMNYAFPVGDASSYQRADIEFLGSTGITDLQGTFQAYTTSTLNAAQTDCNAGIANPAYDAASLDNGEWSFSVIGGSTNATEYYNVDLYPTNYSNGSGGFATVMLDHGSGYVLQGACDPLSDIATGVFRDSCATFSEIAVAQHSSPLPIDLLFFNGKVAGSDNVLKWVTVSETNNDYFLLERSTNGETFEPIGEVDGAGTTNERLEYEFIDHSAPTGLNYYRLKQVDFDGASSYSRTILLKNGRREADAMVSLVYPNPTRRDVYVDLMTYERSNYEVVMTDHYGNVVYNKKFTLEPGFDTYRVSNIDHLAQGVYLLKVTNTNTGKVHVEKITKM